MLKRHNKVMLLTLAASLSVTSLVACSSKSNTPAGSSAAPASAAPAATTAGPKPELKSLQIWQKDDYNTYPVAKFLEEKTGYKVQYDMLPQDKAADKLNILIASGEPYDAITTGGTTDFKALFADYAKKGRDGKISLDDLAGGTFTISNGGTFGSLLSTPILNPPQSAILGMHKIEDRPVVVNGQIVIRPMMYLAMSYDHRIVDGKEAVGFLVKIKENIEDPARLLLGV